MSAFLFIGYLVFTVAFMFVGTIMAFCLDYNHERRKAARFVLVSPIWPLALVAWMPWLVWELWKQATDTDDTDELAEWEES